ncbi:MAG: endonuclease III domain-containing protein [Spirochaetia bacterium]
MDWDAVLKKMAARVDLYSVPSVTKIAESRDPFRVLISTMISLRTKDDVTIKAADRLLSEAHTPAAVAGLSVGKIESLIYPAGFYRVKAGNIKKTASIIQTRFDGKVPAEMGDLLSLPGVGRKTANLVLGLGFGIDAICVDTHVHRIPNRLAWITTDDPEETEGELERILPKKYWVWINSLLVTYGKKVCLPVSPLCSTCPLEGDCPKRGVAKHR